MKTVRFFVISIVLCSIVLFSLSCAGHGNPLIGKWESFAEYRNGTWVNEAPGDNGTFEFLKDGTVIMTFQDFAEFPKTSVSGAYKVIDRNRLEISSSGGNLVLEFSVSGNELTLFFSSSEGLKLRKVGHSSLP